MLKKTFALFSASLLTVLVSGLLVNADNRAMLSKVENVVELKYGTSLWRPGSENQPVRPGTSIRTGSMSKAEIVYPDGTLTRLGSRGVMKIMEKEAREIKVDRGRMWFKVNKNTGGMKIHAPGAVAAIVGTEGLAEYDDGSNTEREGFSSRNLYAVLGEFQLAEGLGNGFSVGLTSGSAIMYRADNDGNPVGQGINIDPGTLVTFTNNDFLIKNFNPDQFKVQNQDISNSSGESGNNPTDNNQNNQNNQNSQGSQGNQNNQNNFGGDNRSNNGSSNNSSPANLNLDRTNPTTEQIPNNLNNQQNPELSPTTGTLEIIIK